MTKHTSCWAQPHIVTMFNDGGRHRSAIGYNFYIYKFTEVSSCYRKYTANVNQRHLIWQSSVVVTAMLFILNTFVDLVYYASEIFSMRRFNDRGKIITTSHATNLNARTIL